MQTEFTGDIHSQPYGTYFGPGQFSIKFSSPMANQHHKFYLSDDEICYLSCTESKWTIMNPTTRYLLHAVRHELRRRGYNNLIIKNSLADYSKSRELTFPVSLFCLMRGLFLPPALAAKNADITFREDFNDSGAPRTVSWIKRFTDAVDRYYTNRYVDMSITNPNTIFMKTPPAEILIKAYFQVIFQKSNRVDLFCVTYDDLRDYYVFGISPSLENSTHVRVQNGAKFIMEVIRDVEPIPRSISDVKDIFDRKLQRYRDELKEEGFNGEIGSF